MSKHHSSVNYVEPNFISQDWAADNKYQRAPRLEDYCMMLNIEVEVFKRDQVYTTNSSTDGNGNQVYILSAKKASKDSDFTVNFMGGTKVECHDKNNTTVPYLTTHYADMYVGDLYDYGTTEMIGIKSVDIEYQSSCVPIITIKFTDVRGLSLFQPTELSRQNSYQGIGGINADHIAQSFFQCFFRVPMPKYTITLKGYYGKPVTYEVACDKFTTNFNSQSGDFDIEARFIGYSYSFLTDVSMDALLAAPYCPYIGKDYWKQKIEDGTFTLPRKGATLGDGNTDTMPTLIEVMAKMEEIIKTSGEVEYDGLTNEELTHTKEITDLMNIRELYDTWYEELYKECLKQYGKNRVFLFQEPDGEKEYYQLLVLDNAVSGIPTSLGYEYEKYSDDFKKINEDLYAAVEKYNSQDNVKKLNNVSQDFSDYQRVHVFKKLFLNPKNEVIFNGFDDRNTLPRTSIVNNILLQTDRVNEEKTDNEYNAAIVSNKKKQLQFIYNDGVRQYVDAFAVQLDYQYVTKRINALQADANRSSDEKNQKARTKKINAAMLAKMGWYPSIENFTRIMMAHVDTLMEIMYQCADACKDRTAEMLGVTVGEDGNCCDVRATDTTIPPFPRVSKDVLGSDGIVKKEDAWVGEIGNGSTAFVEEDVVNGLFEAVKAFSNVIDASTTAIEESNKEVTQQIGNLLLKRPVTVEDFFITKSPWGDANEISEDLTFATFAGKVAMRMFHVIYMNQLNNYSGFPKFGSKEGGIKTYGAADAANFYDLMKITNSTFISKLNSGEITSDFILTEVAKKDKNHPWGSGRLMNDKKWIDLYTMKGQTSGQTGLYPFQDVSFKSDSNMMLAVKDARNGQINENVAELCTYGGGAIPSNMTFANYCKITKGSFGIVHLCDNSAIQSIQTMVENVADADVTNYSEVLNWKDKFDCNVDFSQAGSYWDYSFDENNRLKKNGLYSLKSESGYLRLTQEQGGDYIGVVDSNPKTPNGVGLHKVRNVQTFKNTYKSLRSKKNQCTMFHGTPIEENDLNIITALLCIGTGLDESILTKVKNVFKKDNGLSAIKKVFNGSDKQTYALYMPKILALKLGGIIFANGTVNSSIRKSLGTVIPISSQDGYAPFITFINNMCPLARMRFAKYYHTWAHGNANVLSSSGKRSTIASSIIQIGCGQMVDSGNIAADLLAPVLMVIGNNRFYTINEKTAQSNLQSKFNNLMGDYLTGFIDKLKELYVGQTTGDTSTPITTVQSASKTTDDMRKSLYLYLKQLYDKWIPTAARSEWYLNNFFPDQNSDEGTGNKFYFIDSYYNKINDKLVINPQRLADKLRALLSYQDLNVMMLGFMTDIYSINKCMMMPIQNFADLSKQGSMEEMFKPIPYNDVKWHLLNKKTSFVVIYPYQQSKNLNVANNEFNNDGFMLNDENETPMAIRTRESPDYYIPSFGVSYGAQYQSYFKDVNVNMDSPVATQQSIMAKHYILKDANEGTHSKAAVGQDLYDIYSNQSYTCSVTMLGCAWVQPLMYFVLLNVPLFRGSYLIMKVKHSITPGNFTTTFTGCRMANVSTPLIEDIFSDDFDESSSFESYESQREKRADVDNDCPYKIYPLFNEYDGNYTFPADSSTVSFCKTMVAAFMNHKGEANRSIENIKLVCAQFGAETSFGTIMNASYNYGQITRWQFPERKGCGKYSGYDDFVVFNSVDDFVSAYNEITKKKWPDSITATSRDAFLNGLKVNRGGGYGGNSEHPYQTNFDKRYPDMVKAFQKINVMDGATKSENNKDKDSYEGLFQALQQSCNSTPSIGVILKKEYKEVSLGKNKTKKFMQITQDNGSTDKLGNVFDVLLNGYYDYIQELYWVYANENTLKDNPTMISVIPSLEVKDNTRRIYLYNAAKKSLSAKISTKDQLNEKCLRSLIKKYGANHTDIPQIKDNNGSVFDKSMVTSCDDLIRTSGTKYSSPNNGKKSEIDIQLFGRTIPSEKSQSAFHNQFLPQFMTKVPIKVRTKANGELNSYNITFNKKLASNIQQVFEDIAKEVPEFYMYNPKEIPAYKIRYTRKDTLSNHGKGAAIDINPRWNPYRDSSDGVADDTLHMRRTSNKIVQIFARHGFGWGGSYHDYMHFSFYGGS